MIAASSSRPASYQGEPPTMHLRPRTARLLLGLGLVLAACSVSDGAEWSRFRGPNCTGVSDDKNIPVQWRPENVLWKTPIPGVGHSSPVLWGDKLFLQSASKDAKDRLLLCLDAKNGKVLWEKSTRGGDAKIHKLSSFA